MAIRPVTVANGDMTMILAWSLMLTQALVPAQVSGQPAPSPVTISVVTQAHGADVAYRTVIRNSGSAAVAATVTQQLPEGVRRATATDGGGVRGDHIQWTATVPGGGTVTLHSTATTPIAEPPAFSSVCVVDQAGNALDCASVVAAAADASGPPLWRRLLLLVAVLLAVGVLVRGGRWLWRHRPKWKWSLKMPRLPQDRTRFAVVTSAGAVVVVLAVALLAAGLMVKSTVTRMTGTLSGGWSGTPTALALGTPVSDQAVEYTMYQAGCAKDGCTVVVAARNTSGKEQQFYRSMQRLYTAPDKWVSPDNAGTFFQSLPPGARRLATLHFPIAAGATATRLELREGAFARGVYYDLG